MDKKVIIFGPWVGEFSYELSWWNPECRKIRNDHFKDCYAVHLGFGGRGVMYKDFIDEYIPHPIELEETLKFPATYGEHINGQDIIPQNFLDHLDTVVEDLKGRGFTEMAIHKPKDMAITRERCLEDHPYGEYVHYDVDSDILEAGGFEWSVVVLGTEELDEDFPLGIVIPGPGASNEFHAKLTRQYMGFDPNMNFTSQNLTSARIQQINSVRDNHLLQVQIYETADEDGDGDNDSTMALFISDTNYYGADHSVIFIGTDLGDATVMDTISAVIVAKNDPPKIATLPDTVMYENDSLWLKFGYYTSDVDDDTLKFTISAVTNDNKMTILPMGTQQEFLMSSSVEDSVVMMAIALKIPANSHPRTDRPQTSSHKFRYG